MHITELYLTLVKSPNIPKVYREIRDHYLSQGMLQEAEAFANLIYEKFQQDVRFNESNPYPNCHAQQ